MFSIPYEYETNGDAAGDLSDYHATVVGTVVGPDYGLFFHIGDGAMAFTAAKNLDGIDQKCIAPVMRYLESVDDQTGSKALANTLASSQTHAITGDDKTLLIAMKRS